MRLDPRDPAGFTHLLGLAQFSLEQFREAAASFEAVTRLNPDDEHPFAALAATYGHLGRKADATSAVARFNALRVGRGGSPLTIRTMPFLGFFRPADVERLRQGLRLTGVPVTLLGSDFDKNNRLKDDEIRALVFGHRLHGRSSFTGEERSASVMANGAAELSGDWVLGGGQLTGGIAVFDRGELCYRFGTLSYCGPVFRNPGGTKALENEYLWDIGSAFTFSQVE
jgi:hypothetical protein